MPKQPDSTRAVFAYVRNGGTHLALSQGSNEVVMPVADLISWFKSNGYTVATQRIEFATDCDRECTIISYKAGYTLPVDHSTCCKHHPSKKG